ncbi:MAG: hypothetical protein HZB39_14145 [Planctomycetes bacterium]|nr:hypothetical protein [Planctomycetota bacterium]
MLFASAVGRTQSWSMVPTSLAPAPRGNHSGAYDMARSRFVIFGGQASSRLADTWEFDGVVWQQRFPSNSPSPSWGHAMAYDPNRGRCVLFGGATGAGDSSAVDETWEWDGSNWTRSLPPISPTGRLGHAMAYDWSNGRVVMFGGRNAGSIHENDTWAWDGANWTLLATTGPTPRCCFDVAWDFTRSRILLFGGWNAGNLGDTWDFDGVSWQPLATPIAPTARWGHRMADDLPSGVIVLFGGIVGPNETWEWNGTGWSLRSTAAQPALINTAFDFDWRIGRPTMFGGSTQGFADRAATWTYGNPVPATVRAYGSACPGPIGTPQLGVSGGGLPWMGQSFVLQVSGVSPTAILLFGWSDTAFGSLTLPLPLASLGAPGCSLLASPDAVFGVVAMPIATFPVTVPYLPPVAGLTFFAQSVSLDVAANQLGITTSNGLAMTIGWR